MTKKFVGYTIDKEVAEKLEDTISAGRRSAFVNYTLKQYLKV